jgi:hypothetical protein
MKRCGACRYYRRGKPANGLAPFEGRACEECIQASNGGALLRRDQAARKAFETSPDAMLLRELAAREFSGAAESRAGDMLGRIIDGAPKADRDKLSAFYAVARTRAEADAKAARARELRISKRSAQAKLELAADTTPATSSAETTSKKKGR